MSEKYKGFQYGRMVPEKAGAKDCILGDRELDGRGGEGCVVQTTRVNTWGLMWRDLSSVGFRQRSHDLSSL